MQPVRILFITDHGGQLGGAEHSMLELIQELQSRGHRIYCIIPSAGAFTTALEEHGVECWIRNMPVIERNNQFGYIFKHILFLLWFAVSVLFLLHRRKIDIIHANKTTSIFYAAALSVMTWKPLVWHVRNYNRHFGFVGKLLYRLTDRVICISNDVARPFFDAFGKRKVAIVYNGVSVQPYNKVSYVASKLKQTLNLPANNFLVGVAGRITAFKNIETFVEALSIIAQEGRKNTNIKGVIIGDCITSNPMQMHLDLEYKKSIVRRITALKLELSVHWVGFTAQPDLYIRDLDVLVLPSIAEPFGRILIEAMALGVPVIGSRSGGIPEIIEDGHSGLLFEAGNAHELAQTIMALAADPIRRRALSKAGWERARNSFSTETYTNRVEEIYRSLLSGDSNENRNSM